MTERYGYGQVRGSGPNKHAEERTALLSRIEWGVSARFFSAESEVVAIAAAAWQAAFKYWRRRKCRPRQLGDKGRKTEAPQLGAARSGHKMPALQVADVAPVTIVLHAGQRHVASAWDEGRVQPQGHMLQCGPLHFV